MTRRIIQIYRGTSAQNDAFTGESGELTMDTTRNELRVHDGSTVGGHIIYTKPDVDTALSGKANIALDNITSAGKQVCANMAMPSGNSVAVTLGVSGASYTATANGYFNFRGMCTAAGQYAYVGDPNYVGCAFQGSAWTNGEWIVFTVPVKKGKSIIINYNTGANNVLYFIKAEGEM